MNKLSVKESHIYITQALQRQGAYRKDKVYPQAMDLALTKANNQIVKARLVPNATNDAFEINTKFTSDIQTLIKSNVLLSTLSNNEFKQSYGILPYDFSYLLSDKSYVTEDCKPTFKTPTPTETKAERVICIPMVAGSAPYYRVITVGVGTSNEVINTVGFQTLEERVYVIDYIIEIFNKLGVSAYWENYRDIRKPNSFLLVTNNLNLPCNLIVDGVNGVPVNLDTTYTYFKSTLVEGTIAVNRDVKADFVDSALGSVYHRPTPDSPLATLESDKLVVYNSERFLVSKIYINYIRKPKRISLALNQGSELSATVHEEICDVAVELLKAQIEDPSYQMNKQDIDKRILNT